MTSLSLYVFKRFQFVILLIKFYLPVFCRSGWFVVSVSSTRSQELVKTWGVYRRGYLTSCPARTCQICNWSRYKPEYSLTIKSLKKTYCIVQFLILGNEINDLHHCKQNFLCPNDLYLLERLFILLYILGICRRIYTRQYR